ncbi:MULTISPECIES: FadR/GntR family transcriptional regulator [Frankia]|uniref:GntR-family transcriptional regulator n=1 Tax=Frankia alni (strain DSM 45986 / CECT 9034 / ACN14a) TaxID=326424 RepID=Q0RH94_FRAAA|nr:MULTISPECIES: GntR family transcriptional regulator [Frankia]CAJ63137.1 Putative GntR-family transcriptional regulator [Frankia alni ACN14a]
MSLTQPTDTSTPRIAPHPVRLARTAGADGAAAPAGSPGTPARALSGPLLATSRVGQHVRVPKTAELVAAHLRRQIVRGELHEGDALPPEAVLMEQFGVSRPTLREAFRVLESEALISVRRGAHGGARVHTPNGHVAARYTALVLEHQHTTLADIHTAHTHLEPAAIRLLATTATDTHLTHLTTHLTTTDHALATPHPNPTDIHTHHLNFHTLLLTTPANHTLTMISSMLRHILDATTPTPDTPTPDLTTLRHQHTTHHQLLTHLTNHDPDAAETLWRHHLTTTPHTPHQPTTPLDLLGD